MEVRLEGRFGEALADLGNPHRDRLRRYAAEGVDQTEGVHVALGRNLGDQVQVPVELRAGGVDREEDRVEAGLPSRQRGLDREVDGAL